MPGIFISYREADAKAWAISLRDELAAVFGADQVYLDKDTQHAGNWRDQIQAALKQCRVVLIVIGPRWLTIVDEQNRPRIQLSEDVHRWEIALALRRPEVTLIPVLVEDTPLPTATQLPEDLRALCAQQARKYGDSHARRQADLTVLVRDIQSVGGIQPLPGTQDQPVPTQLNPARLSWLRLDVTTLASAVVLTLLAGIYAYAENMPLVPLELLFLLLVFCIVVLAVRWLWGRIRGTGPRRT